MSTREETDEAIFTFFWRIENFRYCLQENDDVLESPPFAVETLNNTEWMLQLYPNGKFSSSDISCFIQRLSDDDGPDSVEIHFELSLLSSSHQPEIKLYDNFEFIKKDPHGYGWVTVVARDRVFGNDRFLPLDILTIRLRMWNSSEVISTSSRHVFANTRIRVDRRSFLWLVKDCNPLENKKEIIIQSSSKEFPSLTLKLFSAGGPVCEERFLFEICLFDSTQKCLVTCNIALYDPSNEKCLNDMQGEHYFGSMKGEQSWTFPGFINKGTRSFKTRYRSRINVLTLRCKFVISIGSEKDQFSSDVAITKVNSACVDASKPHGTPNNKLSSDLKCFYEKGMFTDFKIEVDGETFAVHKNILCARSAVFSAMLTNDTKEKASSSVHITDLDSATVKRMLEFMYTDTTEGDLPCESASKLYIAASKYDIAGLKEKCSSLLTSNISELNCLEMLVLANMLCEVDFKLSVMRYIADQPKSIIKSEEWNQFEGNFPQLAFEMWRHIYNKNKVEP